MIMRATQKKMMSKPVTSTDDGRNVASSCVSSGQPSVEWHHSADENHVSSTSAIARERRRLAAELRARLRARVGFAARDVDVARARRTTPGIWWPHHSWREMHQSWMLLIQCRYVVEPFGRARSDTVSPAPGAPCGRPASLTAARHRSWIDLPGKERMRRRRRLLHVDEPLVRQHRLDDFAGALAARHDHRVRLLATPAGRLRSRSASTALRAT